MAELAVCIPLGDQLAAAADAATFRRPSHRPNLHEVPLGCGPPRSIFHSCGKGVEKGETHVTTDPEAERIWSSCAQTIRNQVSDAVWRTTFSGARARAFDQRSLVLVVPTSLQKARIERRYFDLISDAVDETGPDITVRIEIDPDWSEATEGASVASTDPEELPRGDSEPDAGQLAPEAGVRDPADLRTVRHREFQSVLPCSRPGSG